VAGAKDARVGFLHEVVDIRERGEAGTQIRAELGFVLLNFFSEPARAL
jgi:hypothetical protein